MSMRRTSIVAALCAGLAVVGVVPAAASSPPADAVPSPTRLPSFSEAQSSGVPLGSLRIPAIGVDETIRAGVALGVIDQGVAQWAGTARPGAVGNVVLAGHRTTRTAPFHDLDRLQPGDLIFLGSGYGYEIMYRVSGTFVVDPSDVWITYDFGDSAMVTMFACHPKGSARYRIVVQADLVAYGKIA